MRRRRFSRWLMVKMFLSTGSPGSSRRSTPSRPAAIITPSARYGLQDGSGMRTSQRVDMPRLAGTRTSGLRFFSDQATLIGAS